jgi:hypothetical protein
MSCERRRSIVNPGCSSIGIRFTIVGGLVYDIRGGLTVRFGRGQGKYASPPSNEGF